jgi:hypothetical protein
VSDTATRLKRFLQAVDGIKNTVASRICLDHVDGLPDDKLKPYIWFRRRVTQSALALDSPVGEEAHEYQFDLEVISKSNREAQAIAATVRTACHCYRGAFDDSTIQGMFVNDQDDDYQPMGIGEGTGLLVVAMDLQVFV